MTKEQLQSIKDKVLGSIESGEIAPKPRWHFVLRNSLVWIVGGTFLIFGAISFAMVLLTITHNVLDVHRAMPRGPFFQHLLETFPYIWLLLLVAFISVINWAVRHSKNGYRYATWKIVLAVILASLILGSVLHYVGASKRADDRFGRFSPRYATVEQKQNHIIQNIKDGQLLGQVLSIEGFIIVVENPVIDTQWTVDISEARIKEDFELVVGARVVVRGAMNSEDLFKADRIAPLKKVNDGFDRDRDRRAR